MDMEQLLAGFFWGMVAMGFLMYAKKERDPATLVVGVVMIVFTYLFKTFLSISIAEVLALVGFYLFKKKC